MENSFPDGTRALVARKEPRGEINRLEIRSIEAFDRQAEFALSFGQGKRNFSSGRNRMGTRWDKLFGFLVVNFADEVEVSRCGFVQSGGRQPLPPQQTCAFRWRQKLLVKDEIFGHFSTRGQPDLLPSRRFVEVGSFVLGTHSGDDF